ncbi:nucleotide kinase [Lithospermum erythrorhizon]|uniref:1-phosphatidylinositol 4-kinase n=1 Tax=Lithospermum erythrorhizon TaxID=34254 RepID=A0AAV3PEB0_LITER
MSSAGVVVISPTPDESVAIPPFFCHSQESIVIFLALSGSMVPMRVMESDSIESVKLRIQTSKGFVVKNQKLVYGGRELARSNCRVSEYGVGDGNVLHLVLRLKDLQGINVKTSCGKEFTFNVERSRDVGYVKRQIAKKRDGLGDLEDEEVLCNGEPVDDQSLINDISKSNDAVIHLFVRKSVKIRSRQVEKNFELSFEAPKNTREYELDKEKGTNEEISLSSLRKIPDILLEPVIINPKIKFPSVFRDLVNCTLEGLDKGHRPIRSSEGTGGVYFMVDSSGTKYVSVFKPIDEEPMALNNPQGLPLSVDGEGLKKGTRVGEGALRECAAYILDHPRNGRRSFYGEIKGFAGVPPTLMVRCLHDGFHHPDGLTIKMGSLQMFIENNGSCEDLGPSAFPVEEVHKIAAFDLRMANVDRHAGNILVSKDEDGNTLLIPIDHGYCLPDSFEDCTFDWLYWPQARKPFNADTVEYIKSLDADEDIALLHFFGWELPPECARTLRISTMLLKKGVEKGLTPYDIGNIMCRETLSKESVIEEIVQEALDCVLSGSSEVTFMETVSSIMDSYLGSKFLFRT